ncbi:hypothetical protein GCM10023195_11650 [Actinoallomurus liliacearum]|uniref:Uncharacterized protein n=1 Tax=Actinoallomurus liliacearum TaxID=1080073 RepID=A0ABP8TF33_9ACTN
MGLIGLIRRRHAVVRADAVPVGDQPDHHLAPEHSGGTGYQDLQMDSLSPIENRPGTRDSPLHRALQAVDEVPLEQDEEDDDRHHDDQ